MFHEDCLECCFIAYPRDMEVVTALFALNGLGLFKKNRIDVPSNPLSLCFTGCACVLNCGVRFIIYLAILKKFMRL